MVSDLRRATLSVVVPAYNESGGIADVLARILATRCRLTELGLGLEVLVVDDGSHDGTVAATVPFAEVRVIRHPTRRGYGAAIKTGFRHACGEYLAFLDADGTYPPESLPPLCGRIMDDDLDLVVGSRMSGASSAMPAVRRAGNLAYARLLSLIGFMPLHDITSGMRVLHRRALVRLLPLPDGLEFTPAMSTRAVHERLRMAEIPITYASRAGDSKLSLLRDGFGFTSAIVWTSLDYNPVRVLGLIALALLAGAGAVVAYVVALRIGGQTVLAPWQIYLLASAAAAAVTGLSLFSLGAMFNYLVSLFHRRPIRQGLFRRPLFEPSLDHHFGWLGLSAVVLGLGVGLVAFLRSLGGWPMDRLWVHLLAAAVLVMGGTQLAVAWVVMRVLESLAERHEGEALADRAGEDDASGRTKGMGAGGA